VLRGAYIAAAVRCAPPDNRPLPDEIANCAPFLARELAELPRVAVVLALGAIACGAYWRLAADRGVRPRPRPAFTHGGVFEPPVGSGFPALVMSYHPSRQNTNTGRLTPAMLDAVWRTAFSLQSSAFSGS
jgi:uracil-DNA glycosylase family 4